MIYKSHFPITEVTEVVKSEDRAVKYTVLLVGESESMAEQSQWLP